MFGKPVAQLRIFAAVLSQIGKAERHEIDELDVLSELALNLPYEDAERQFRTLVSWGRQADLFDHDPERHKLFVEYTPTSQSAG